MQKTADLFKKTVSVLLSAAVSFVVISGLLADKVSAAGTQKFTIECKVDTKSARSMLSAINDFRTSGKAWYWNKDNSTKTQNIKVSELTYDYNLEQVALQRAYEIAIFFDHSRPGGGDCFECVYDGTQSWGENIAAGTSSTSATFDMWKEENEKYSGQGHRRNMLQSPFSAIGIAHVTYQGTHYWVQEFGTSNSGAAKTADVSSNVKRSVNVKLSLFTLTLNSLSNASINKGDTKNLPSLSGYLKSGETWGNKGIAVKSADFSSITWTSSNTKAVTIEKSAYKGVGAGTSKLTAKALLGDTEYSKAFTVTVKSTDPDSDPGSGGEPEGDKTTGWRTDKNGKKYYYKDGKKLTGWLTISGNKYFLDPNTGAATVGVRKIYKKYYLFNPEGVMLKKGWKKDGKGNTYYLKKNGVAYTKKWCKKRGKWYYFGKNGKMVKKKTIKIGKKK